MHSTPTSLISYYRSGKSYAYTFIFLCSNALLRMKRKEILRRSIASSEWSYNTYLKEYLNFLQKPPI